jgi:hypothetical protein
MKQKSIYIFLIILITITCCSENGTKPPDSNGQDKKYGYLKGFIKDSDTGLPKNSINSIIIIQFQEVYDVRKV